MRQLLAHREDVMKRGRATRADAARCARGCKQKLAQEERGREAEETRTARKLGAEMNLSLTWSPRA